MENKILILGVVVLCLYVLFTSNGQKILFDLVNKTTSIIPQQNYIVNPNGSNTTVKGNWIKNPKTDN